MSFILVCVVLVSGCVRQKTVVTTTNMPLVPDKESYLKSQLQNHFANPDVHCELGRHYLSEGLLDKAKYHFEASLGCDPAHRNTQAAYIKLFIVSHDSHKAAQLFTKYKKQLLSSPRQMCKLAKALGEEGLDEFSLNCFEQALVASPESAETHRQLGYFHSARGETQKALIHFQASIRLNPNQADIAGELGRMGIALEKPDVADEKPLTLLK